ncbi:MAG: hypothetical protein K2Q20_04500 [Phycisphaerales bacterium]|nr:hypothetical protein [Phycisphaerales bacterium]
MNVFVDDSAVTINAPTLAEALRAARQEAQRRGRVVVDATLDGVSVPDEMLSSPGEETFAGSNVRFATADPIDLVASTLRGVAEALQESKAEHIAAAELIQQGQIERAMSRLTTALGVWEQARTAVINGSELLGYSIATAKTADGSLSAEQAIEALTQKLGDLKRAFVVQDWSALSDTLAYDMPGLADVWCKLLAGIADDDHAGRVAKAARGN